MFRRLEAGINPELELLRFLTEHDFENIAQLAGWYAYAGRPMDATLGILQRFVANGAGRLGARARHDGRGSTGFLRSLHRLGEVTGTMHTLLGSDSTDPSFCPEQPSSESLGLLTATIDDEIETHLRRAARRQRGRRADPRPRRGGARAAAPADRSVGGIGRVIRHHGDFHLGQTLWADDDWVILDFEGEPARSLPERRRKRSPLRDVAGMLRSFAYAASAAPILRGVEPPAGWEARARAEFLGGLPRRRSTRRWFRPASSMDKLLAVFELEKAVYELRYELNNRPDWVKIPVAGILRMLEEEVPV